MPIYMGLNVYFCQQNNNEECTVCNAQEETQKPAINAIDRSLPSRNLNSIRFHILSAPITRPMTIEHTIYPKRKTHTQLIWHNNVKSSESKLIIIYTSVYGEHTFSPIIC